MFPDLLIVRNAIVQFFVLRDGDSLFLIDTGFVGGVGALDQALVAKGWSHLPVRGILHTHGHLDHTLNTAFLARRHTAWIAAPERDAEHYISHAEYEGMGRFAGMSEALGRDLLSYQPFTPDRWLRAGDEIDLWGGLEFLPLPGHTHGHGGFYSARHRLLFSGDLFASFRFHAHLPPPILNQDDATARDSARRALELDLAGVLPCHADQATPAIHLERLRRLVRELP